MHAARVILFGLTSLCVGVVPGACGGMEGGHRDDGVPADFAAWAPTAGAFDPVRLRVHPLTRITRDTDGTAVLACHVELRDASNQVVKALGVAAVELYVEDAKGHADATGQRWEVDLREPKENAAAFDDVVTRTYVLRLGALPPAAARLADAVGSDEEAAPFGVAVRFAYKVGGRADDVRVLEARGTLSEP
jgi:hypothetical protein